MCIQYFHNESIEAFSAIATIRLQITCQNTIPDEELMASYWPFVIDELQDMSPPIRERLTSQKPAVTGGKMTLICFNDMELQTMKGKVRSTHFRCLYNHLVFPNQ